MPYAIRAYRCLSLLILVLIVSSCATMYSQENKTPTPLKVTYTGALYGYFRDDAPSYPDKPDIPKTPVRSFIDAHGGDKNNLILGMGDNFGPEFGASIQDANRLRESGQRCQMNVEPAEGFPEALYKDDLRVAPSALCDNVAHFLLDAGFRALVPGREDFIYGSGWLRATAANLRMAGANDPVKPSNADHRITMLAANLRLKVQSPSKSPGASSDAAKNLCPLLFAPDLAMLVPSKNGKTGPPDDKSIAAATCSTQTQGSPPELLDVLGRMSLLFNTPAVEKSVSYAATHNPDEQPKPASDLILLRHQIISNQLDQLRLMTAGFPATGGLLVQIRDLQTRLNSAAAVKPGTIDLRNLHDCVAAFIHSRNGTTQPPCPTGGKTPVANAGTAKGSSSCAVAPLEASGDFADIAGFANGLFDKLYEVCTSAETSSATLKDDLIVSREARLAGIRAILRAIEREQRDRGYTITNIGGSQLIIGVVGQSVIQDVSMTNQKFCFRAGLDSVEYSYCTANNNKERRGVFEGDVYVSDPVPIIVALARAVKLVHPDIQSVIVMAQMPHTLAEELAATVQSAIDAQRFVMFEPCKRVGGKENAESDADCAKKIEEQRIPPVAFIVSEAQDDHASGDFTISISRGRLPAPVLTPRHAYHIAGETSFLLDDPASIVTYSAATNDENGNRALCPCVAPPPGSPQAHVRVLLSNQELNPENSDLLHAVQTDYLPGSAPAPGTTPLRGSALVARKLMGMPEKGDPDPPSPYASISLGRLPDGNNRTVADLLRDADCDKDSAGALCDLAVQRLLLTMLQRGSGSPTNPLTVFANPRGEVTDVAMLESRDIWLGELPEGYAQVTRLCTGWLSSGASASAETDCELRVALDIILWKGDQAVHVQAKGSDLTDMMSTAQSLSSGEKSLATHDVAGEWLATFGIGRTGVTNLPSLAPRTDAFWVPEVPDCVDNDNAPAAAHSASSSPSPSSSSQKYCVNGKTIQPDGSYWIITSDHLAQDDQIYKNLAALPDQYRVFTGCYLTQKIAQAFEAEAHVHVSPCSRHLQGGSSSHSAPSAPPPSHVVAAASGPTDDVNLDVQGFEINQQLRPMFHIEFGKVVGGLDLREAVNGDSYVAEQFQGVTDSRASAASQRELDIEQQMRGYFRFRNSPDRSTHKVASVWGTENRIGAQSDLEFDRSAQGNISGKAENPSFPLNSVSGGFFFERHMFPGTAGPKIADILRWLPPAMMTPGRFALVFAPRQYQRQIIGNYLYFPFSSTADGPGPKNNSELTAATAPAYGFSDRLGMRETATSSAPAKKSRLFLFDSGSYWEAGAQSLDQRHVLRSLTITTPDGTKSGTSQSVVCPATGILTFADCVKQITIDGKSYITNVLYGEPTEWGLYWDVSLQKQLSPARDQIHKIALQISSKGDRLAALRLPLSTETRWDAPLSTAVSFQILPNLSVSPTYSGFWYSDQVARGHLFVNEGIVTLRWYFNRDSMSPFDRQVYFNGPASDDQTKSMHMSKGVASQ